MVRCRTEGNVTFVNFSRNTPKPPPLLDADPRVETIREAQKTPTIEFLPVLLEIYDDPHLGPEATIAALNIIQETTNPALLPILLDLERHSHRLFFDTASIPIGKMITQNPGNEVILDYARKLTFEDPENRHFEVWFFSMAAMYNPGLVTGASISRFVRLLNSLVKTPELTEKDHICIQDLAHFMGRYVVQEARWSLRKIIQDERFNDSDKHSASYALGLM